VDELNEALDTIRRAIDTGDEYGTFWHNDYVVNVSAENLAVILEEIKRLQVYQNTYRFTENDMATISAQLSGCRKGNKILQEQIAELEKRVRKSNYYKDGY